MKRKAFFLCIALYGCKPGLTSEQVKTVRDYEVDQLQCVDRAKTVEDSHACRCNVMKREGRACPAGWEKP